MFTPQRCNIFFVFLIIWKLLLCTTSLVAQSTNDIIENQVENLILDGDHQEAYQLSLTLSTNTHYHIILQKLALNETLSYKEYYTFIFKVISRSQKQLENITELINSIHPPKEDTINLDYVYLQWLYIKYIRDLAKIDQADIKNEKLKRYINNFPQEDTNVKKASILAKIHDVVLLNIAKDTANHERLVYRLLNEAKTLNDEQLILIVTIHVLDSLANNDDLLSYLEVSRENYNREFNLSEKSPYFARVQDDLINALVFERDHNDEVLDLLEVMYNDDDSRLSSYICFADFMASLNSEDSQCEVIFEKFEVNDFQQFAKKLVMLAQDDLGGNDLYLLYIELASLLKKRGLHDLGYNYMYKSIQLTRQTYSKDLANSLANFKAKTKLIEKESQVEIEKLRSKGYSLLAIGATLFLIITVFIAYKKYKSEREKELLLKEIHHRIKNNFQLISSLIDLQTKNVTDNNVLQLVSEVKSRINSMAIIHQKLYQNKDKRIDFKEYIELLVKDISDVYGLNKNVNTKIDCNNLLFDIDTAIPLGLVINEIVTNAYKYAFTQERNNQLLVSISKYQKNQFQLLITDNGQGIPANFDYKKSKSLGLHLVHRLVRQLHGKVNYYNNQGLVYEIHFTDTNYKKSHFA